MESSSPPPPLCYMCGSLYHHYHSLVCWTSVVEYDNEIKGSDDKESWCPGGGSGGSLLPDMPPSFIFNVYL